MSPAPTGSREVLHIVGGASFPASIGTLSVSWPLAVLRGDEEGFSVDLRSTLLKRMFSRLVRRAPGERSVTDEWLTSAWDEVSSVQLARRSIAFTVDGGRGCRFVTLSRKKMNPLISELARREVVVRRVRSTIPWYWSSRR
jgi:hypothetical protein